MLVVDRLVSPVGLLPERLRPLSRRGGIGTGCLIVVAVLLVIVIAIGIYAALSWKGWFASMMREGSKAAVAEMQVPEADKTRIIARIEQLAADFEQGRLTFDQLGTVAETIVQSPVLPIGAVQFFEQNYVDAKLPEADRADARLQLQRFARGIYEKKVPPEMINVVMIPISDSQPGSTQRQIRPPGQVTVEQVREFISNAKARADEYKIPDEPFQVNIADELINAIDRGMGLPPSAAAPPDTAPALPTQPPPGG